MCEMKIRVNTQKIHTVKKMHFEIECDTIMSNQNAQRNRIIYYLE